MWELGQNVGGGTEEEPVVGGFEHGGVVVRIARRDDAVVQFTQGIHGLSFLVFCADLEIDDAVFGDDEAMAEQRGHTEVLHEGSAELLEGVGEDEDLGDFTETGEELHGTGEWFECGDDTLDPGHRQAVGIEDLEPATHEDVVVGLVTGGSAEFGNSRRFGDGDPDLGNQDSFEVEGDDVLGSGTGNGHVPSSHAWSRSVKKVSTVPRSEWPELQRRTLRVLVTGQVIAAASLASAVTVGAYVIQTMLGQDTPWGGMATATVTTGTAFMAQYLSRVMGRGGRRRGFVTGYALAVVGGLVAALGTEQRLLPVFLIGLFLYGSGQAANLLARYAATDLAEPDERGRAMSLILFASTFGAIFGPILVVPAQHLGQEWFGWSKYTGPWAFAACFFVLALVNSWLRLRPDPLEVSGGLNRQAPVGVVTPNFRESIVVIRESTGARMALLAMVISQATMVAVMTMTPVHMKAHGHESASPYVISLHIAGMYAFSPLVGRYADTKGRVRTIMVGASLLIAATVIAALAGESDFLLFPALWLLGIGWSFGLIGGSSLLVESVPHESRVQVQGSADLLMSLCGGIAGFSSGFVRRAVGFHMLSNIAALLALLLILSALRHQRQAKPSLSI